MSTNSDYTELFRRVADGDSVRKVCVDLGIGRTTFYAVLAEDAALLNQYARAMELRAEHYMDEIIEIADDSTLDTNMNPETGSEITNHEVIQRSKLRVDTRKWLMGKLSPKKYGDKIQQELSGPNGGPIRTARDLTDDELAAIAAGGSSGAFSKAQS